MKPCVAVIDDHYLLAAALAAALRAEGYEVVAPMGFTSRSLRDLEAEVVTASPNVALVDLDLQQIGSGFDLIEPLTAVGAGVVVVSAVEGDAVAGRCLERGAIGWLPKRSSIEEFLDAVAAVAAGRTVMPLAEGARLRRVALCEREAKRKAHERFCRLTPREASVLAALMEGQAVSRIASAFYVSETTVRSQVRAILTKLGVRSQLEAVAVAVKAGWNGTSSLPSEPNVAHRPAS